MKPEKIGIMQPYFFPYLGYWQLIHAVDVFVVYDDGKMITNGWIHRNRMLNFDGKSPRTIGVPLKKKMVKYLTHSLQTVCDYLDIKTRFVMSSTIDKTGCESVEDKAERICKTIGITHYINPIGGTEFYNKDEWAKRGLTLNFLRRRDSIRYLQFGGDFVPDLSIIDMLMFCSKEEIQEMLNEYDLV